MFFLVDFQMLSYVTGFSTTTYKAGMAAELFCKLGNQNSEFKRIGTEVSSNTTDAKKPVQY